MRRIAKMLIGCGAVLVTALGQDAKVEAAKTNVVEVSAPAVETKVVLRTQAVDEIVAGRTTFKGPLVVFAKKQNPLEVFNPFRPQNSSGENERPLRDPYLGAPKGIVLFSVSR